MSNPQSPQVSEKLIKACGECSMNMNGIYGEYKHADFCPKSQEESWAEEFDETFKMSESQCEPTTKVIFKVVGKIAPNQTPKGFEDYLSLANTNDIKKFISSTISKAVAKERERIIGSLKERFIKPYHQVHGEINMIDFAEYLSDLSEETQALSSTQSKGESS